MPYTTVAGMLVSRQRRCEVWLIVESLSTDGGTCQEVYDVSSVEVRMSYLGPVYTVKCTPVSAVAFKQMMLTDNELKSPPPSGRNP